MVGAPFGPKPELPPSSQSHVNLYIPMKKHAQFSSIKKKFRKVVVLGFVPWHAVKKHLRKHNAQSIKHQTPIPEDCLFVISTNICAAFQI